jgi:hypothetical protein
MVPITNKILLKKRWESGLAHSRSISFNQMGQTRHRPQACGSKKQDFRLALRQWAPMLMACMSER